MPASNPRAAQDIDRAETVEDVLASPPLYFHRE
jgi:hypothetical protein